MSEELSKICFAFSSMRKYHLKNANLSKNRFPEIANNEMLAISIIDSLAMYTADRLADLDSNFNKSGFILACKAD
jgi:hypothetical protein